MKKKNISIVYPEKESKILEFKEMLGDLNKIIRTCTAFANGVGGEIIIGVEDKSRKIVGVSTNDEKIFYQSIANKIYDCIVPTIVPEIYEKNFSNKNVLIIRIHPGSKKPYFVKQEGTPKGVYIRIGPHTRNADEVYIRELIDSNFNATYDARIVNTDTHNVNIENIIDYSLLKEIYIGTKITKSFLEREEICKKNQLGQLLPTNAAVLMFSKNPQNFISESVVLCTHFKGISGRDVIQTREISGGIPLIVHETISLLASWTERNYTLNITTNNTNNNIKGRYQGKHLIPLLCLREALINALIHRKYFIPGPVKIALYDDRLEIFSPGAFPSTITPENIGDGSTYLRNPLLAKFARKFHLIEKLGSGIKIIFDECAKAKLTPPQFREDGDFVKIIFSFHHHETKDLTIDEIILKLLKANNHNVKPEDVQKLTTVSRNTISNAFKRLLDKKQITRYGKGRGVYYKLRLCGPK
ncbi:MAG: putative DNA binding domain-containing protein [Oligoflexia bacterium]|nr:putative DNA binding domain-containing protein [Oligoflexia bacterium]